MSEHFLQRHGMMVIKDVGKVDVKRLCRSMGCRAMTRLAKPNNDELGWAESIEVREVGSTRITVFNTKNSRVNTIVLRGSSKNLLEDA